MALASGFSLQGALPGANIPRAGNPAYANVGGTPQSNALAIAQGRSITPTTGAGTNGAPMSIAPKLPAPPTNQPVKAHTVNNVDGSSVTQTYHPPTPGIIDGASKADVQPTALSGSYNPNVDPIIQTAQNAPQGTPAPQPQSQQQNPQPPATSYPGLISALYGRSQQDSPEVTAAREALKESQMNQAGDMATNRLNPIPIGDQTGRETVIKNEYLQQQNALTGVLNSAVTTQGQQLNALGGAVTASSPSNQFMQVPYSNQVFDSTGKPVNGGASSSLNDAVSTIAQRVQSGQMSYDQAISSLSGYGQGGVNALQQALGPNFNVAQSNTLAGQQGAIGPALEYARTALTNLKSTLANLQVPGQNSNIPLVGGLANGVSSLTGIGGQQTSAKDNAIAESRNAIQKVLASVQGGTPTDYTGQSHTLLPDNATPQQIDAAIQTLETLGTAKQNIYGNPGNATSNTTTNGTQPAGWL